jgi:hypothetical protein
MGTMFAIAVFGELRKNTGHRGIFYRSYVKRQITKALVMLMAG